MDMSYRKAWEMVAEMNPKSTKPLVITHKGGEKGRGAEINSEERE